MDRLENYMMDFSVYSLKKYLGENLVDTLIEWVPTDQSLFSKKRLIEMIITIQGVGVFKNKEFRKELLQKMDKETILGLQVPLDIYCSDLEVLVEKASKVSWRDNAVSHYLLKVLNMDESILQTSESDKKEVEIVQSADRFYELLDYQYFIKQQLLRLLNDNSNMLKRALVQMPTGTGKTKTAMHTLVNYYTFSLQKQGLVIWLAHTTELLIQAYETFRGVWSHLGDGETTVYQIWGDSNPEIIESKMNGVAFCGIAKLNSLRESNPEKFYMLVRNCRLIFFDEAHKAAAEQTRKMVENLMEYEGGDRSLIGLSATPGRKTEDTFDNKLLSNMFENRLISIDLKTVYRMNMTQTEIDNTKFEENIIHYFQNHNILAKVIKEELIYQEELTESEIKEIKSTLQVNGYRDFTKKALETIGRNKSRNLAILNRLISLNQEGKVTIVFACSVEQAKLLSAMLALQNIKNSLVTGDMSPVIRKKVINDFKDKKSDTNIIINYEVLTTGFDATNIDCVFITRPTQSVVLYSQMIGRGLRGKRMGGNETCLLIDVKDNLKKYNEEMAFTHFENYWEA